MGNGQWLTDDRDGILAGCLALVNGSELCNHSPLTIHHSRFQLMIFGSRREVVTISHRPCSDTQRFRMLLTMLMSSAPQNAGQKPATSKPFTSIATTWRRMALMTTMKRPSV